MTKKLLMARACAVLAVLVFILTGCISQIRRSIENPEPYLVLNSAEPLTGYWEMTRTNIEPESSDFSSNFIPDQVIPRTAMWKITSTLGHLKIDYGAPSWFNPPGLTVVANSPLVTESIDRRSCIFSGSGSINLDGPPGLLAIVKTLTGQNPAIALTYADNITVSLTPREDITTMIVYSASGSYNIAGKTGSLIYRGTASYTGIRR